MSSQRLETGSSVSPPLAGPRLGWCGDCLVMEGMISEETINCEEVYHMIRHVVSSISQTMGLSIRQAL